MQEVVDRNSEIVDDDVKNKSNFPQESKVKGLAYSIGDSG
jgi:hypothetical protein